MWDRLALILLIIGGLNWGLVGIFGFDLVAWLFGGAGTVLSRTVYILVAISAVWCISFPVQGTASHINFDDRLILFKITAFFNMMP